MGGTLTRMFKKLAPGIKISITRSITTVFENYMATIDWNEKKFSMNDFMKHWGDYIHSSSSWFNKLDEDIKRNPEFHQELAEKINETIDKILSEEPTKEQMEEIEKLQETLGEEYDYSCKSEAKYLIEKLKEQIKKNNNS